MSDSIQKRQTEERSALVENLKKMPIIQIACEKTGVSRATFYRWKNSNKRFSRQVDEALKESVEIVNDMAEAKLIASIKEGNITALIYWVKHGHTAYSKKVE